jgi:hypothetical protein
MKLDFCVSHNYTQRDLLLLLPPSSSSSSTTTTTPRIFLSSSTKCWLGCSLRRPRLPLSLVICPFYFHNYITGCAFAHDHFRSGPLPVTDVTSGENAPLRILRNFRLRMRITYFRFRTYPLPVTRLPVT